MSACFGRQNANEIMTADGRKLHPCVCFRGEVERREDADDKRFSSSYRSSRSSSLAPQTVGSRQRRSIQKRVVGCLRRMQLYPNYHHQLLSATPHSHKQAPPIFLLQKNGLLSMWRNVYRNLQTQGHQKEIPGGTEIKEEDKSSSAFWTLEFPAYLPNSAPRTLKIYTP